SMPSQLHELTPPLIHLQIQQPALTKQTHQPTITTLHPIPKQLSHLKQPPHTINLHSQKQNHSIQTLQDLPDHLQKP
ncbi:hypothetical protein, partial [Priestia megaterium]|uniref:hypothetical protein n=1 Tax=Priestia megaterium TaxID=1404 RepID=UPI001F19D437